MAHIFAMYGIKLDSKKNSLCSIDPAVTTVLHPGRSVALAHLICSSPEIMKFYMDLLPHCVARGGFIIVNYYGSYDFAQKTIDRFLDRYRNFILDPSVRTSFLLQHSKLK